MTDERKATDILLKIESNVAEILSYVRNNDLNYRLILAQLRGAVSNTAAVPVVVEPSKSLAPSTSQFSNVPDLKQKIKQAMAEAAEGDAAHAEISFQDQIDVENTQSGKRRGTRIQTNAEKQVTVHQKILGMDDKSLFMARVEIFDEGHNLVRQTKTNQTGKWLAQLLPGRYEVVVSKAGTNTKSPVEATYWIDVPNQDANIELEMKKV